MCMTPEVGDAYATRGEGQGTIIDVSSGSVRVKLTGGSVATRRQVDLEWDSSELLWRNRE
jgi:hypothetical protein